MVFFMLNLPINVLVSQHILVNQLATFRDWEISRKNLGSHLFFKSPPRPLFVWSYGWPELGSSDAFRCSSPVSRLFPLLPSSEFQQPSLPLMLVLRPRAALFVCFLTWPVRICGFLTPARGPDLCRQSECFLPCTIDILEFFVLEDYPRHCQILSILTLQVLNPSNISSPPLSLGGAARDSFAYLPNILVGKYYRASSRDCQDIQMCKSPCRTT